MNKCGFTLIELLVVIILIAAIVLLALPKITNSVKNYNTNVDKTTFNIIKEATKLYVNDNPNSFMKSSENTYCVSLNELIEKNYLKNTIEYNNQDITNIKVMKVTYDNGFNYELVNKNDCERIVKFDTVCEADSEQLYASNELDVGYKYNCKVDPDRARYTFYVLSYNDENGNIIFDKENAKSVNLIMDRNINSDGTPTTESISEKNKKNGIYNIVAWISKVDYIRPEIGGLEEEFGENGVNKKGPVTAIKFLNIATNSWINIVNLNISYDDEGKNFVGFKINGKARLPYKSEVKSCDNNNIYLFEYLHDGYWSYDELTKPTNTIREIYGYWVMSSYAGNLNSSWYVDSNGGVYINSVSNISLFGVRPVITLEL